MLPLFSSSRPKVPIIINTQALNTLEKSAASKKLCTENQAEHFNGNGIGIGLSLVVYDFMLKLHVFPTENI